MIRSWQLVLAAVLLASCASQQKEASSADQAASTEATVAEPDEAEKDGEKRPVSERRRVGVEDLVRTNNQFAFDLFKSLPSGNLVFSPHGVSSALAIVYAGAEGVTQEQIGQILRLEMAEKDVHAKFSQLNDELRRREKVKGRDEARGFRLRVVNGVWYDGAIQPTSRFLRIAHNKHLAEVGDLDFRTDADGARKRINGFLGDATAGKIPELLGPGVLTPLTRVVIANAVYFDAPWRVPFPRHATRSEAFQAPSGAKNVPTMRQTERHGYLRGDGFAALELPYGGGEVTAVVMLPDGDVNAFASGVDANFFDWMVGQLRQTEVHVELPKFELRTRESLPSILASMGMPDAFDPSRANFEGLAPADPEAPLYISEVIHEGVIRVDEDGTEAAAALAAAPSIGGSAGAPPVEFHADRPFLFAVRDMPTGAILFLGRVVEP